MKKFESSGCAVSCCRCTRTAKEGKGIRKRSAADKLKNECISTLKLYYTHVTYMYHMIACTLSNI